MNKNEEEDIMKKLLAVLFVLTMIASLLPAALAEDA